MRGVVVAPDLDRLRGRRQLPLHLDSTARPVYDFASGRDRAQAYLLVLLEAVDTADIEQHLERAEPLRLWPVPVAHGARRLAGRTPGPGEHRRRAVGPASGAERVQVAVDPFKRAVIELALRAAGAHGFALAGGNAPAAHHLLSGPTQDIDLSPPSPAAPGRVVDAVQAALAARGHAVRVMRAADDGDFASFT